RVSESAKSSPRKTLRLLVVEHYVEQGAVYFEVAVVADEAQFAEFVHEVADPRPRSSDDSGERLLADCPDDGLRSAFLPEIRQQQQHSRQPFFTGVEKLV